MRLHPSLRAVVASLCLAGLLAGCSSNHSVLDPHGPEADVLYNLFWIFTIVTGIVWFLVVAVLLVALFRGRRNRPNPLATDPRRERRFTVVVSTLAVLTGAIVIVLAGFSYSGQAQVFARPESGLTVKVTGHQWWWEIEYEDADPSRVFTTANEIHVPAGEPVTVELTSDDVIHSFWVPSLMGKMDAIPGRTNQIQFTAAEAGTYRGQCAEFCGLQHAHMAMLVHAEPKDQFESWKNAQIAPAASPVELTRKQGEAVFLSHPCVVCHTVRGTTAGGRVGPDLTHLASRTTIAADTLPFTRGALAAWVVDPQSSKPGAHMPNINLAPDDLQVLLDYLEGLK